MNTNGEQPKEPTPERWGIVEIMGHHKLAGKLTEETMYGAVMLRVDVPATPGREPYTKYFGGPAIFGVTPCSEELTQLAANEIERYNSPIPVHIPKALPSVPTEREMARAVAEFDDDGDGYDDDHDIT